MRLSKFIALTCAAMAAPLASAQGTYPDRPIRMVLPFSAGGGTDAVGRIVAGAVVGDDDTVLAILDSRRFQEGRTVPEPQVI